MAKYYQDFVGLNTLVYEPSGWFTASQGNPILSGSERKQYRPNGSTVNLEVFQNQIGRISPDPVLGSNMGQWTAFAIKNFRFPYSIPIERSAPGLPKANASASYFNALMTKRNGPYGFPSWKQIRISQNPLSRTQRRNNIFTYVREPGNKYDITINNKQYSHLDRFGPIRVFTEPVVAGSYKPLAVVGSVRFPGDSDYFSDDNSSYKTIAFSTTLGNETVCFANTEVNEYYDTVDEGNENYEDMKELYLGNAIEEDKSPFDRFDMLVYRQTVWPKMKNSYLNKTRSRVAFVNKFWRDKRANRAEIDQEPFDVNIPFQSMWPLDSSDVFTTMTRPTASGLFFNTLRQWHFPIGGKGTLYDGASSGPGRNSIGGPGLLQNSYCSYMRGVWIKGNNSFDSLRDKSLLVGIPVSGSNFPSIIDINPFPSLVLTASCVYALRHTVKSLKSVVSLSGMPIAENSGSLSLAATASHTVAGDISMATSSLFRGDAFWDAPKQAGITPFYDSYTDFAANIRLKGQGYSIIPEFRISTHVETYETLGVTEELKSIFEISGALQENFTTWDNAASASTQFYEIYSNSDFLQHFELIKKDHEGYVDPGAITLRCKAIKKFLPYKGLYPADRCVQLSQQFFNSYKDYVSFEGEFNATSSFPETFSAQTMLQPLFAPGVLFNTIKAGVACDFPIFTENTPVQVQFARDDGATTGSLNTPLLIGDPYDFNTGSVGNAGGIAPIRLSSIFAKRIPFEALVEPRPYLANLGLVINDPHPFSWGGLTRDGNPIIRAVWNGRGDNLYQKMIHNFLAEIPTFFLPSQNFSTLISKESRDPTFGNAVSGNFYAMRVKMFRTTNKASPGINGFDQRFVQSPQDVNGRNIKLGLQQVRETYTMYSRPTAFGPPSWGLNGTGSFGGVLNNQYPMSASDSMYGNNYLYTPPYYHGEAWCDLIFECSESRKYTADEIISAAKSFPYYTRFWWPGTNDALRDLTGYRNDAAIDTQFCRTDMLRDTAVQGKHYPFNIAKDNDGARQTAITQRPTASGNCYFDGRIGIEGPYLSYGRSPWAKLIAESLASVGPYSSVHGHRYALAEAFTPFPILGVRGPGRNWGDNRWTDGYPHSASWAGPPYTHVNASLEPGIANNFYALRYGRSVSHIHGPQHPFYINTNAMQLNSTLNLFGKAMLRSEDQDDHSNFRLNVATEATNEAYTRWCIQPKFETPMFNFNKYKNLVDSGCTSPSYASASVPRGMWHQYGELDSDNSKGIFMQVTDIPSNWYRGALCLQSSVIKRKVRSLADLCGFNKNPVKLGQTAGVKRISEAVVAVPFYQKDGRRQFFTIPRRDIEDSKKSLKYEEGDTFRFHKNASQTDMTPQTGRSVYEMVKKISRFSMPPSMDFVRFEEIDPFAMYIFEFTHDLKKQDLANIWQNLPPDIGTSFQEAEVSLSHQLLADELMGGGADIQFRTEIGMSYDPNTEAREPLPDNIQWMVFKVKRKAETNYFDKVIKSSDRVSLSDTQTRMGNLTDSAVAKLGKQGDAVTYNWPYDYFSLVELVKLDAEITFAEIERKDGRQVLKKKIKGDVTKKIQARAIPQALGKARMKKE